jgi:ABC-type lipoprotein release transport system permease subunit
MSLIIRIAWRNIFRHKGKSLVIGVILFIGALIMTVGNGVISGMDKGLKENIIGCFTGDAVIISDKQRSDNVFFESMGKAVEPIYNTVAIKKMLEKEEFVESYLSVGKNGALVLNEDGGTMGSAYLMGVDFAKYREIFPDNIKPIEGRLPLPGEKGALVPTGARKTAYDFMNIWFIPENETLHVANLTPEAMENKGALSIKNTLVLLGSNDDNSTSDVRLGIKGVIRYKALNKVWGSFVLVDIETYRRCMGYFSASAKAVELAPERTALLAMGNNNLDDMFNDTSFIVKNDPEALLPMKIERSDEALSVPIDVDAGVNNMVLVFFKQRTAPGEGLKKLNAALKRDQLGARAVSWKKAVGALGSMAMLIKSALFVFVMFLFFVAIIIIVNTLSMAALERATEIGMMRAVGARKGFISGMFFSETAMLSFVFGGLGIVTGIIVVRVLALMHLTSSNDMIQLLCGGDTFQPFLSISDIAVGAMQLAIVTIISMTYPIKVARSITPLDAMSRE